MKGRVIRHAFYRSLPVMAGYIVLGIGFGILLRNAGYGVLWAFAMSVFIYAGSLQYVGVSLLAGGASLLSAAITSFMVNARHLFYSISMIDRYKGTGKYKPYLIFALTDETYSLVSGGVTPDEESAAQYWFFISLFNHIYWVAGSVLGSLLGAVLPFSTAGIEFSMTALFVAAYTEQWLVMHDHVPAVVGLLSTLLCLVIFGRDHFLIPAMLLITLILTLLRGRRMDIGRPGRDSTENVASGNGAGVPGRSGRDSIENVASGNEAGGSGRPGRDSTENVASGNGGGASGQCGRDSTENDTSGNGAGGSGRPGRDSTENDTSGNEAGGSGQCGREEGNGTEDEADTMSCGGKAVK